MTPQGVYEIFPLEIELQENTYFEQKITQNSLNLDKNTEKMSNLAEISTKNIQKNQFSANEIEETNRNITQQNENQKISNLKEKKEEINLNSNNLTQKMLNSAEFTQKKLQNCSNSDKKEKARISFADLTILSHDLYNNLKGCSKIALIAATIGPQVDAYIRRAQITDPVYASICQATGAMYIEEVVNNLNEKIKQQAESEGFTTRPRYSPGYGDIPLTAQRDFFRLLNCQRIGLTLMPTLIMAPEKSVTAFIGLIKN